MFPTDLTTELGRLPTERVEAELCELAAHIDAAMCRWLTLLGEYDERAGYESWECASAAQWVAWRCGVAPATAWERLRVARRLRELPVIVEAFGRGALSYSKVRALTRVATPESEYELVDLAMEATAAQLERIVRASRRAADVGDDLGGPAEAACWLRHRWDDEGHLVGEFRLAPEDGALLLAAVEEELERRRRTERSAGGDSSAEDSDSSAEESAPTPDGFAARPIERNGGGRRAAEALVTLAETAMAVGPTPLVGGERHQVVLTMDLDAARGGQAEGRLDGGPALGAEACRTIACDSTMLAVMMNGLTPAAVAAPRRTVPRWLRRMLVRRDGGCRVPGCGEKRFVDAHHIVFWGEGGPTTLSNLVLLCRRHHRALHQGRIAVETLGDGADGRFRFRRADGSTLEASPVPAPGETGELVERNLEDGLAITAETPLPGWDGAPLRLADCVEDRPRRSRSAPPGHAVWTGNLRPRAASSSCDWLERPLRSPSGARLPGTRPVMRLAGEADPGAVARRESALLARPMESTDLNAGGRRGDGHELEPAGHAVSREDALAAA